MQLFICSGNRKSASTWIRHNTHFHSLDRIGRRQKERRETSLGEACLNILSSLSPPFTLSIPSLMMQSTWLGTPSSFFPSLHHYIYCRERENRHGKSGEKWCLGDGNQNIWGWFTHDIQRDRLSHIGRQMHRNGLSMRDTYNTPILILILCICVQGQ